MAKGSYRNYAASAVSKTKQKLGLQGKPGSGVSKPKASKPKSGTTSYRQAYDKAGGAAKLGDYGAWEKKAKAWNQKKYGTTNPTAKAKGVGISKAKLAKDHLSFQTAKNAPGSFYKSDSGQNVSGLRAPDKKSYYSSKTLADKGYHGGAQKDRAAYVFGTKGEVQTLKPVNLSGYDKVGANKGQSPKKTNTETKVNQRMSDMVASAGAQESLLDGKDRRRLERKARIQDRADNRANRRQDRADNRISRIQNRADKRTSRITNKSKAKSKSSVSAANQDLAMQKLSADIKKYSAK
tara:strand:- start:1513 stop:2394 length:882 start_codon:yes stop_codon:yes gene_type:complete